MVSHGKSYGRQYEHRSRSGVATLRGQAATLGCNPRLQPACRMSAAAAAPALRAALAASLASLAFCCPSHRSMSCSRCRQKLCCVTM